MALWTRAHRFWRTGLLLATCVLMVAGCGQTESPSAGATTVATATATATPAPIHLTWQVASPASQTSSVPFTYAVAPSDGRVTYGCGFAGRVGAMQALVWSTQNSGLSWSKSIALPYSGGLSDCAITVDANDPERVAIGLNTAKIGASPDDTNVVAFLSQDGGATWRPLPKVGPHTVGTMTSFGQTLYVAGGGLSASGGDLRDLWASRDGGASWRALGATSLSPNPWIWINPQTGDILGTDDFDLIPTLWRSENGGASWTRIGVPNLVGAGGSQTFLVAPNGAGWRICATGTTAPGPNEKNVLACSADLGATWTALTGLNPTQHSPKGFTYTAPADVFAVADDGSLLASYDASSSGIQFESLAPGASAWVPMSDPPLASATGGEPVYTSGPGGGMLWIPGGDTAHPFAIAGYP
jgi:hypothetical protein